MARFIFELPDDLAARVEAFRVSAGMKATAVAVRVLLERGLGGDLQPADAAPKPAPSFSHGRSRTVVVATKRERVDAPRHQSRLKGEWSPPGKKR